METDNIVFSNGNPEFIEFTQNVKKYIQIDDDIRKLREATKIYNKNKSDITQLIINFMNKNGLDDINTNSGKIKCKTGTYKKPLNQKYLLDKLVNYFNNIEKGKTIADFIFNNRETVERITLTRKIDKNKNTIDI